VDVSLINHSGGIEKHIFLVAESFHDVFEEMLDACICILGLEQIRTHYEVDDSLDLVVDDVIPSIF
jgi:hypothetical protein